MPEQISNEQLTGIKVPSLDRLNNQKTLYEASYSEIFWKNFLAGFGRSLGGIIIYALFLAVVGSVLIKFMLPVISPMFESLQGISDSLNRVPRF